MNTLAEKKHVHFVGVGGIGISAVARMLLASGVAVSGSDRSASEITKSLEAAGATIFIGQASEHLPANCDLVVYTVAIPADNPELVAAKARNLPLLSYPQTLELISQQKYTVAVAGTHGKTTTTAMLASILLEAGLDPTVLVGGLMTDPRHPASGSRTNFIVGKSDYFVVEADEYKKSFHNLFPRLLVITNIDADHLDFYKDLADIQAAFAELVRRVPTNGFVVCNPDDPHVAPVIAGISAKVIDYRNGFSLPQLRVPGAHNRENASAAAAAALSLGVVPETAGNALTHFPGTWRRFEYKGETPEGALVFDDYAHNPIKVAAAIAGAREAYPEHSIIVVFQPHLYSRTKTLFNEFIDALATADRVILLPIYAARESLDASISSEMLAEALNAHKQQTSFTIVCPDIPAAKNHITRQLHLSSTDVIVVMGAGDITALSDMLVAE